MALQSLLRIESLLPRYGIVAAELPYRTPPLLFRNLRNGRFEQLSEHAGPTLAEAHSGRGAAFGDFDDDGDLDTLIWNRNEPPSLLRNDLRTTNQFVELGLVGTKSNRAGIGAVVTVAFGGVKQSQAVLSQSSFTSASDLRLHFGLGQARQAKVFVQWPSGLHEHFQAQSGAVRTFIEGKGTTDSKR